MTIRQRKILKALDGTIFALFALFTLCLWFGVGFIGLAEVVSVINGTWSRDGDATIPFLFLWVFLLFAALISSRGLLMERVDNDPS